MFENLPSVSRRDFLRRALLSGAGLLAAPQLLAADSPTDPHSWALLSDLHLPADRAKVARGVTPARRFEQVTAEILALRPRPAGLIISGDLALDHGEAGDYALLRELLEPVRAAGLPVHLALGNHDNREHFLAAFPETSGQTRPLASHCVSVVRAARANWFLLDSLEKTLSTPGLLGEAQLAWLAQALDAHKNQPAILVLHHHLDASMGNAGLKDAAQLFDLIRPRRQVKACVFGHTHNWRTWPDESGIQCVNLPAVAYAFGEGTPAGWVHATIERQGLKLELRCLDPSHPSHGKITRLAWRQA